MDINQFDKETKQKILETRGNINSYREQLADLQKTNKTKNYYEQHKKLFVKTDVQYDQGDFDRRVKNYNIRRERSIGRMQRELDERKRYPFAPQLNDQTLELTKDKVPFSEKIDKMLERARSSNALLKRNRKDPSRSPTPNGKNRKKTPSGFTAQIKEEERVAQARKFFIDNIEWKKQIDDRIFAQQVTQNLVKEALPSFKPKLNDKKNEEMVKTTFNQRVQMQEQVVQEKVDDLSKQIYNHTFTPKLFKNNQ
jgi:hypothetical protein